MNLQTINASASPEVQINENFETLDFASVYGKRPAATSGLTWGYYGGRWSGFAITADVLTLTGASTNYLSVLRSSGVISTSTATTNWDNTTLYARVYKLTTAGGAVTAVEDHRAGAYGVFTSGDGDVVGPASATADDLARFDGTTGKLIKAGIALSTSTTLAEDSDAVVATQKAVKAYADALISTADAMVYKGATDCSTNPNYPAADAGHTYRVSVAGKIGGASGKVVEVGDWFICNTDSTAGGAEAAVGTYWNVIQTNLDGAVIGPASATGDAVVLFDGTTGKLIKGGGALGTAAFAATGDFATAAQGALADTALQAAAIGVSVQAWDAQLDSLSAATANGVSLITAANYAAMRALLDLEAGTDFYSIAAADSAFATAAQGALADTALQTAVDGTPASDHTASGPQTNTFAAGASITVMDLVYLGAAGKWLATDASAAATGSGLLAISLETKADTEAMNVALPGTFVRDDTWAWTVGAPLYMSETAAAITETQPTTTDAVIRVVGFAVTADVMYFNPSPDYITHV